MYTLKFLKCHIIQRNYIIKSTNVLWFSDFLLHIHTSRQQKNFQLLPSKTDTMKKFKTLQKRWWTIQSQLPHRKRNIWNSTICGAINSNLFRNSGKVKVLLFGLCVEAITVLHMEEKMISIDTRITQSIRDMWMLHNKKES